MLFAAAALGSQWGNRTTIELKPYAVPVPTAASVFMSTEKCFAIFQAAEKNRLPGSMITAVVERNRSLFKSSIESGDNRMNQSVIPIMLKIMIGTVSVALTRKSALSLRWAVS